MRVWSISLYFYNEIAVIVCLSCVFSRLLSDLIRGCVPWSVGLPVRNKKIWITRNPLGKWFLSITAPVQPYYSHALSHIAPVHLHHCHCPCPPAVYPSLFCLWKLSYLNALMVNNHFEIHQTRYGLYRKCSGNMQCKFYLEVVLWLFNQFYH